MFVWVTLPENVERSRAVEGGGGARRRLRARDGFYATKPAPNTLRLSFSTVPPEKIRAAVVDPSPS